MKLIRHKGALDVIRFNLPIYLLTFLTWVFVSVVLFFLSIDSNIRTLLICVLGVSSFWFLSSILASHWVYDRSRLTRWTWLNEVFLKAPQTWLSIHAGLDKTTHFRKCFKNEHGISMDIYHAEVMTESSIKRARKIKIPSLPAIRANLGGLPFRNQAVDAVFMIFCVHEVRDAKSRSRLFAEVKRILKPGGSILIVEHGRDLMNFLAFGPGYLHFLPYSVWFELSAASGLTFQHSIQFTPFVRALLFKADQEMKHVA